MENPTSQQIKTVIETFESITDLKPVVDMANEEIEQNDCGTIACHAGHYALAKLRNRADCQFDSESGGFRRGGENVSHIHGSQMISYDLGFLGYRTELLRWASENPELWGNRYGRYMFAGACAFTGLDADEDLWTNKKISFADIVNHWRGVYQRVKASE